MTNYNWNYPTTVWVGKDRAKDLEKACDEIKTLNPLLVTDKDLINLEFIKDLINDLEKKFKLSTFSNFSGNPTGCLLYTSPSPRDGLLSRMPSSA